MGYNRLSRHDRDPGWHTNGRLCVGTVECRALATQLIEMRSSQHLGSMLANGVEPLLIRSDQQDVRLIYAQGTWS